MMITSLSEAVAPTTSRGVAFSPSGMRWGIGLSIRCCLEGDPGLVVAMIVDVGLKVDTTGCKKECVCD